MRISLGQLASVALAWAVFFLIASSAEAQANCPNGCSGNGQCTGNTCRCYPNWLGEDCSYQTIPLVNGSSVSGNLQSRQWSYYSYQLSEVGNLLWGMQHEAGGDCDLYVNPTTFPTRSRWYMRDISTDQSTSLLVPNAQATTWYAGVYGFSACHFQLTVYAYPGCPKNCSGHGICLNGACQCDAGYASADCSLPSAQTLISGQWIMEETIRRGEWKFYATPDIPANALLSWTLNQTTRGDADIFVQVNHYPNFTSFIGRDTSMNAVSHVDVRALLHPGSKATYIAGVFGFLGCTYNIFLNVTGGSSVCLDTTRCSLHGTCSSNGQGCQCNADYNGTNCEFKKAPLSMNKPVTGYVADNSWNYYVVRSTGGQSDLALHLSHTNASTNGHGIGDCDIYVRANTYPTRTEYDYADITADQTYTLTVPNPVTEQVAWYIGVFGWSACEYVLTAMADNATRNCGPHGIDAGGGHCSCLDYYAGETCSIPTTALTSGVAVQGSLQFNKWAFFHISPPASLGGEAQALEVHLQETSQLGVYGNLWLYISGIEWPTLRLYDQADTHITNLHTVYDDTFDSDEYIGVYVSPYADSAQTYNFTLVAWHPDFKK